MEISKEERQLLRKKLKNKLAGLVVGVLVASASVFGSVAPASAAVDYTIDCAVTDPMETGDSRFGLTWTKHFDGAQYVAKVYLGGVDGASLTVRLENCPFGLARDTFSGPWVSPVNGEFLFGNTTEYTISPPLSGVYGDVWAGSATLAAPRYIIEARNSVDPNPPAPVACNEASQQLTLNGAGGTAEDDGLRIELDHASFLVYRNGQYQNYSDETLYNGVLVSLTGDNTTAVYATPKYGNVDWNYTNEMCQIPGETPTLSEDGKSATYSYYIDLGSAGYNAAEDYKITLTYHYESPADYFSADYEITPPTTALIPVPAVDVYHGIDMYLDGSDDGPGLTGLGYNADLTGRYVIQTNLETEGIGGFIEKSSEFSSYYADYYDDILYREGWTSDAWTTPNRGAYFGEPLPNIVNPDENTDIGVGIHFSLGAITQTVSRDSYLIFSAVGPSAETQPVPYTGPVVTNDPETAGSGSTVTYLGSDLDSVISATIGGQSATVISKSDAIITLRVPTGLTQGMHDVVLKYSTTEHITLQNGFILQDAMKVWTKLQSDNTVKMYAKNIIGEGKIQFFHNGSEIAWIRATDSLSPKLSFANGSHYLVRTRELVAGKNAFEIDLDGTRIWRAAYAG